MLKALKIVGVVIVVGFCLLLTQYSKIQRLLVVNSFFEPDNIVSNFQDIDELFPTTTIKPSAKPLKLAESQTQHPLPKTFTHKSEVYNLASFLVESNTEGLMIIHKDTIVYEEYRLGLEPTERHISWSMSKSFIGTIIGIAVEKGLLNIQDSVVTHLPDFRGTGYEGVTVEQLLQMRTGIRFDEDYGDFNSDINRFGRAFALGTSYRAFARSLVNAIPPGTQTHYVSVNTQMLGFILTEVTGKTLTELLEEYLWQPMGMENEGGWIVDNTDFEMALGGMVASLRDYAKLGLLYLHEGQLNGQSIVSKDWISTATAPYEGSYEASPDRAYDYGYQWWVPLGTDGDYFAVGIYDQFVYVSPKRDLVIAKLSADHRFKHNGGAIKEQHISMFQEIARSFSEE